MIVPSTVLVEVVEAIDALQERVNALARPRGGPVDGKVEVAEGNSHQPTPTGLLKRGGVERIVIHANAASRSAMNCASASSLAATG